MSNSREWDLAADDGGLVLTVTAENLGAAAAPGLRTALLGLLAALEPVTVDLSAVRFADTAGLGALAAAAARALPGQLRLSGVGPHLARSLARVPGLGSARPAAGEPLARTA